MRTIFLVLYLLCPSAPPTSGDELDQPLAEQFAALKRKFEDREAAFMRELRAANSLEPKASQKKIIDENQDFVRDWFAMANQVRSLVRAHPDDPASFEGIILLPGVMRTFLDDELVKVVRDHFMHDPRMGRLCSSLAYRSEDWSGAILRDVAAKHPDRNVRGQATYSLGLWSRYLTGTMVAGRERTEAEREQCLSDAGRSFTRVTREFADLTSADGTFKLASSSERPLKPQMKSTFVILDATGRKALT